MNRVELMPEGRASLTAQPGHLTIDVPSSLSFPWVIAVEALAEVGWFSHTRAVFRAHLRPTESGPDDSRAEVDLCGGSPDAYLRFRSPVAVPFRRGRTLWPRTIVTWTREPGSLLPPKRARHGLATSLSMRAAHDGMELKRAFELAGIVFPEYGEPS